MSKIFFRLRHAALASAMALLMGTPLVFADAAIDPGAVNPPTVDAPAPIALDPTPVTAGGAVVEPVVDSGVVVEPVVDGGDRKSTRLNSSHLRLSRMPSSA